MNTAEKIRLPDDCTIGYIIESVLGVPLTRSNLFHSHLENLQQVSRSEIHKQVRGSSVSEVMNWVCFRVFFFGFFLLWCSYCLYFILQITLSYGMFENKSNIINLKGAFPVEEDPSRWETVLCLKGNSTSFYTSKSIYRRKKVAWSLLCLAAHSSSFSKPAAYVTHNATWPISDITGGNLSDYMQLPLEPQKALYYFLHILSSSPQDI